MPVHGGSGVRPVLAGVGELPRHHAAEIHVFAAAPPLPAFPRGALVMVVAAADGGRALRAGPGHGECHSGRGDGVNEGRLPGGCGDDKTIWVRFLGNRFCESYILVGAPRSGPVKPPLMTAICIIIKDYVIVALINIH